MHITNIVQIEGLWSKHEKHNKSIIEVLGTEVTKTEVSGTGVTKYSINRGDENRGIWNRVPSKDAAKMEV